MLHRAMGLNSKTFSGLFNFGIRVIKVWFKLAGIVPEFKHESTAQDTSSPMESQ